MVHQSKVRVPQKILMGLLSLLLAFGTAACGNGNGEKPVTDNTTRIETPEEKSSIEVVSVAFTGDAAEEDDFPLQVQLRNLAEDPIDAVCITCELLDGEGKVLQELPIISGSIEAGGETWIDSNITLVAEGKEVKAVKLISYDILDVSSDEEDGYVSLSTEEFAFPRVITPDVVPTSNP